MLSKTLLGLIIFSLVYAETNPGYYNSNFVYHYDDVKLDDSYIFDFSNLQNYDNTQLTTIEMSINITNNRNNSFILIYEGGWAKTCYSHYNNTFNIENGIIGLYEVAVFEKSVMNAIFIINYREPLPQDSSSSSSSSVMGIILICVLSCSCLICIISIIMVRNAKRVKYEYGEDYELIGNKL